MKFLKKAGNIASAVLLFVILIIGISIITGYILGFRFMAIKTGSMKNVYDVGTLVIVDKLPADEIQIGDIISYVADDSFTVVTHRVIDIDYENECIYTKGDMNNVADGSPVLFENLIGRVIMGIPFIGYLVIFVQGKVGRILVRIAVVIIIFICIQQLIYNKIKKRNEKKDEKTSE